MSTFWIPFFGIAAAARLGSLLVSRRNERALRERGAREHGVATSRVLALAHVAFYTAALLEAAARRPPLDGVALAGVVLYVLAMLALARVMVELGALWTVRLYLAPDHELRRGWLLRTVRHPNYLLNVVPELVGLALVLHAWWTLALGLPVYLLILGRRVLQEERVMRSRFSDY